jgi:citrate lyase subunit beta/citryl-CoA lyase
VELLRSLIFVPGNRRDMLQKARSFNADVIVADLEDSVPPSEKLNAREIVREMAPTLSGRGQKVMVRVNSLDTGLTRDDLSAVVGPGLYGVSVGKGESPWDVTEWDRIVSVAEGQVGLQRGRLKLIPWIENSRSVMRVNEMVAASARVVAVAFGAEDYTDDMGIRRTDEGSEVYFPRALVAVAARAAGVVALDSPYVRFRDPDGLKRDAELARSLGFKGKFAIHPTFTPSPPDVDYARRVVEAWELAEAAGRGSTSLDGNMIDVPVVKRARALLAMAEAIAQRERREP